MEAQAREELDSVVVLFAGDSGDGMQLTGTKFTETSAIVGNDIATLPNYPAEIRAPAGTLAGVSGFQVQIGKIEINTPGDDVDVLVAMNPAALRANLGTVPKGKTIIVDTDAFTKKNIEKAGFGGNPLEDGTLDDYNLVEAPISNMTRESVEEVGLDNRSTLRCKNMFALGTVFWMFSRPLEPTIEFLESKFKKKPQLVEANRKALQAGYNYALTIEALPAYTIKPATLEKGTYRTISGNVATSWGLLAAARKSGRELFLGSYPITPASDILHELAKHKAQGVKTFQAEDEIAGICSAIGASFGGALALTTTSGPGLALKGEALGLAIVMELPLVVVNVQRGGPSTGLPTKTEQSDLLQAMYGRNGESPVIVIAASTPANCFDFAFEAARLTLEHMTPVILLTDGYLANGSEPWKIKSMKDMPEIKAPILDAKPEGWMPYVRNEETLARSWAIPGTEGLEHRLGGLEKDSVSGNVSYDPQNHMDMCVTRGEKVRRVANDIPDLEVEGASEGDILVVGWGGTYGSLHTAVNQLSSKGAKVGLAHFNYINPMPKNTAEVFGRFKKVLVCELNLGQFVRILQGAYPQFDYAQYNKVEGMPFYVRELVAAITKESEALS